MRPFAPRYHFNFILLIHIGSPSVLLVPQDNQKQRLESFSWEKIFIELKEKVPLSQDVLAAVAIPSDKDVTGKEVPAICTAYCILMNQRWKSLLACCKRLTQLL